MGWVDLLALGPTFMRYSGGASVPDSNPATFMVDGAYYNLSISLFDLFGDSPDVVPSKMRMAGRVTASPGATGTAYFGNGYLTDNYIVYAPLDANGEAQFSSGELDVGEAPYKYGNLVVGMESISPSQEVTFEITQFDAYFDVDDDEEPAGECFWTDLVNATQECGASPDPELDTVDAYYIGSIWGFIAVDDLTWNGPVLYTPPAGDVEYPAHTEVIAVTETDEIRAITGNTSVYPPGSVYIDGGRLKTDGVIEVQPWAFSTNTGDLRVDFVDDAWSVLYDGLPSEYKYAAFDPPLAVYPPRVGNLGVFLDDGDVQAYTAIASLTITAHNSHWDPPLYSGAPTSALIAGVSGAPQFTAGATVVPFGDYEYSDSRGLFGITASSGGGWADGVINMQFDLHYKALVAPPQHVAAVLKDCELFSFEQLAEAGADGVTTVPKAGTGLSIPFSFTVSHVASRGNTVEGGTIEDGVYSFILNDNGYDGAVISKTFTDYLLTEHGQYWFPYDMVLVGRLYAIDDLNTPIARIAFMATSGGGF